MVVPPHSQYNIWSFSRLHTLWWCNLHMPLYNRWYGRPVGAGDQAPLLFSRYTTPSLLPTYPVFRPLDAPPLQKLLFTSLNVFPDIPPRPSNCPPLLFQIYHQTFQDFFQWLVNTSFCFLNTLPHSIYQLVTALTCRSCKKCPYITGLHYKQYYMHKIYYLVLYIYLL